MASYNACIMHAQAAACARLLVLNSHERGTVLEASIHSDEQRCVVWYTEQAACVRAQGELSQHG